MIYTKLTKLSKLYSKQNIGILRPSKVSHFFIITMALHIIFFLSMCGGILHNLSFTKESQTCQIEKQNICLRNFVKLKPRKNYIYFHTLCIN